MPSTLDLSHSDLLCPDAAPGVPVIDAARLLRNPVQPDLVSAVSLAARTSGFLYIEHAFRDSGEQRTLDKVMRRFFALPADDSCKTGIRVSSNAVKYGYMPLYGEPAYQPGTVAHVESFDCGRPRRPGDTGECLSVWPDLPGFHDAVRAMWAQLTVTGMALLATVAESAGLAHDFLAARCASQDLGTMRLLHYPPGAPVSASDVGIAAHTDFECITLLYQTAPGLELRDAGGHWRDAPAGEDRLVVLFGDMLERYTNGAFQATGHRVRQTPAERYSVVLFFAVNDDEVVAPQPACTGNGNPPRYRPTTQREHSAREIARAEQNRDQKLRT